MVRMRWDGLASLGLAAALALAIPAARGDEFERIEGRPCSGFPGVGTRRPTRE
jgi:hypothetical protein